MIDNLRTVYYSWKNLNDEKHVGLIAQDLQKLEPLAVVKNPGTGKLALDYSALIAILVSAVQELSERVKYLESNSYEQNF